MATPSGSSGPGIVRKIPNPDSAKKRLFKMDEDEPTKPDTSEGKVATEAAEVPKEKKESPKGSFSGAQLALSLCIILFIGC